ncbi:unnamed protein product, partial [Prorocentrum cordatum]
GRPARRLRAAPLRPRASGGAGRPVRGVHRWRALPGPWLAAAAVVPRRGAGAVAGAVHGAEPALVVMAPASQSGFRSIGEPWGPDCRGEFRAGLRCESRADFVWPGV